VRQVGLLQEFFWLNSVFAVAVLDLTSLVHLVSFVITMPRQMKQYTVPVRFSSVTICIANDQPVHLKINWARMQLCPVWVS